jgi:hypothetical protein
MLSENIDLTNGGLLRCAAVTTCWKKAQCQVLLDKGWTYRKNAPGANWGGVYKKGKREKAKMKANKESGKKTGKYTVKNKIYIDLSQKREKIIHGGGLWFSFRKQMSIIAVQPIMELVLSLIFYVCSM